MSSLVDVLKEMGVCNPSRDVLICLDGDDWKKVREKFDPKGGDLFMVNMGTKTLGGREAEGMKVMGITFVNTWSR